MSRVKSPYRPWKWRWFKWCGGRRVRESIDEGDSQGDVQVLLDSRKRRVRFHFYYERQIRWISAHIYLTASFRESYFRSCFPSRYDLDLQRLLLCATRKEFSGCFDVFDGAAV